MIAALVSGAVSAGAAGWGVYEWQEGRAKRMQFSFCFDVCGMRNLRRVKITKVAFYARHLNLSPPLSSSDEINTKIPALIVLVRESLILAVTRIRYIPKIADSVIGRIAIDVINKIHWKRSVNIEPRQTMRLVKNTIDHYVKTPPIPWAPTSVSRHGIRTAKKPCKYPGVLVVVKEFAQTLCCKIGLSHDTVPSLIGQRPARVDSTGGLRHFSNYLIWRLP